MSFLIRSFVQNNKGSQYSRFGLIKHVYQIAANFSLKNLQLHGKFLLELLNQWFEVTVFISKDIQVLIFIRLFGSHAMKITFGEFLVRQHCFHLSYVCMIFFVSQYYCLSPPVQRVLLLSLCLFLCSLRSADPYKSQHDVSSDAWYVYFVLANFKNHQEVQYHTILDLTTRASDLCAQQ